MYIGLPSYKIWLAKRIIRLKWRKLAQISSSISSESIGALDYKNKEIEFYHLLNQTNA